MTTKRADNPADWNSFDCWAEDSGVHVRAEASSGTVLLVIEEGDEPKAVATIARWRWEQLVKAMLPAAERQRADTLAASLAQALERIKELAEYQELYALACDHNARLEERAEVLATARTLLGDPDDLPGTIMRLQAEHALAVDNVATALAAGRSKGLEEAAAHLEVLAEATNSRTEMTDFQRAAEHIRALAASPGSLQPNTSGDDGWQPIETAPKSTNVLVCYWIGANKEMSAITIGFLGGEASIWYDENMEPLGSDYQPTAWRPLPEAPAGKGCQ